MSELRFRGKYKITATLVCETGLHIGGTQEGFEIGGLDNPVIKDPMTGMPYICGSSLKGKIRSLLEWSVTHKDKEKIKENDTEKEIVVEQTRVEYMLKRSKDGKSAKPCSCGECDVCVVFGCSAAESAKGPTRLTVRDAFPDEKTRDEWKKNLGEAIFTELKMENVIDRITSEANPRQMERVPAGSEFNVEMIYDVYEEEDIRRLKILFQGMHLLEESALGGSGTRGYGKVKFKDIKIQPLQLSDFGFPIPEGKEEEYKLIKPDLNNTDEAEPIWRNFDNIFKPN